MCYTRKEERDLDREARRITEKRLLEEEEASRREEEHARRRAEEQEEKSLTEKVKEMVGVR